MATKRELKAEIITLRKRVDELAARVAALEGKPREVVETSGMDTIGSGKVRLWINGEELT